MWYEGTQIHAQRIFFKLPDVSNVKIDIKGKLNTIRLAPLAY